jgi:vacuolar protein sorting-associated protein 13D
MLEGLATWFLNNYLGKYLELLDTAQLSISLLAGQVELENVPLRKDALRFLEPSVAVRSGQVGHIKLTVPVARMRSEPWTLLLEQVHIVLGPQRFAEYDEEAEDAVRLETKLAALDGIEAEWRAAQETAGSSYYPVTSGWLDYGASFIGTIVENLQLTVRDVHVRYEDDLSIPGTVFSAGLTLASLTARTCDQTWSPRFVHRDAAQGQLDAFKLVELTGLAAYLDPQTAGLADMPCRELAGAMGAGAPGAEREFLLEPVSATANLRRHCLGRPLGSRRQPRVRADVAVEQLNLRLSDLQFQRGITGARAIHMLRRSRQFWRWRPGEPVLGHARRWWR